MGEITYFEYPSPLVWWHLALAIIGMVAGGFAIGAVGLGGVIWVPILLLLPGMEPPLAVGTVFVAAFPSGCMNFIRWYRGGHVNLRDGGALAIGGATGSFGGAMVLKHIPSPVLSLLISAVCMYSGIDHLVKRCRAKQQESKKAPETEKEAPRELTTAPGVSVQKPEVGGPAFDAVVQTQEATEEQNEAPIAPGSVKVDVPQDNAEEKAKKEGEAEKKIKPPETIFPGAKGFMTLVLTGLIIGFLSSISGTGGPLLLFPMLFVIRPNMTMHQVIGLTKPFATALVGAAATGALTLGKVDLGLAAILCVCFLTGVELGTRLAFRVKAPLLRFAVAIALLIVGLLVAARSILKLTGVLDSGGSGSGIQAPAENDTSPWSEDT